MWQDVYCLESVKNYVKLKTANNNIGFLIRGSLQYVLDNLMPAEHAGNYLKISRNMALLISKIDAYDDQYIYICKDQYPITSSLYRQVLKYFELKK